MRSIVGASGRIIHVDCRSTTGMHGAAHAILQADHLSCCGIPADGIRRFQPNRELGSGPGLREMVPDPAVSSSRSCQFQRLIFQTADQFDKVVGNRHRPVGCLVRVDPDVLARGAGPGLALAEDSEFEDQR